MSDEEIKKLLLERHEIAIEELSKKYNSICTNTAYNILKNREDANECVNDAYLGVWNTVPPNNPESLMAYLLKTVRNISINKYVYNTRQKRNLPFWECAEELEYCICTNENTEDIFDCIQTAKYLDEFIGKLNKIDRLLFVRRYWYIDSYGQLSEITGMRENAIRTRLSRIRKSLKNYLSKKGVNL